MGQSRSAFDVVVIGGGIAGLVAANRAAQLGKRVAVLEKSHGREIHLQFADHLRHVPHQLPRARSRAKMSSSARSRPAPRGYARKDLGRAVARKAAALMQWLASEGIDLSDLGQYHTRVVAGGAHGLRTEMGELCR